MVGIHCKMQVKNELDRLKIPYKLIDLGVVELRQDITLVQRNQIKESLSRYGLKLYEDKKCILIEKIMNSILEMIQDSDDFPVVNYSYYLSKKLNYDYTYLANIFSEVKGVTIQQYIILSKIDIAKELILTDDLNLTEISYKLNYSSVAHLSGQFKKVTGLSPSSFKVLKKKRVALIETI